MNPGPAEPYAKVQSGELRGEWLKDVAVFRGVPYAAAPVGDLRWRPPASAPAWLGVRNATAFGPDAMQRNRPASSRGAQISEDCLTLNIWSHGTPDEKRPVMVWFYGGSFVGGSASDARTDGESFARKGVVFVSVNSRVGVFGYLAHPELGEESSHGSAGNYGLLDQIAALQWIRQNIGAFGGDPARVTIFGVSSGGASIALLMTSPLAWGLFDQAILESPGSFRPLATLSAAMNAGEALGRLADLRAMSADEVLALEPKLIPAMRKLTAPRTLRPILDGWVIEQDERAAFEAGAFFPAPTIVGSNADEGSRLVASWPVDDVAAWSRVLDENFQYARDDAAKLYPAATDADARPSVAQMFGDTQFQLAARELARAISGRGKAVYRYVFTRQRPGVVGGPHHGGEVPYVFGHLDAPPIGSIEVPPTARDLALAEAIQGAWVRFAATGKPGSIDGIDWPVATDGFLVLGDRTEVGAYWREAQLDYLNEYVRAGHPS